MTARLLLCALLVLEVGCQKSAGSHTEPQESAVASSPSFYTPPAQPSHQLAAAPPASEHHHLQALGLEPTERPTLAILGAQWCQWCRIFESDVLSQPEVATRMQRRHAVVHVDVDVTPAWLDLPRVRGLPSLVFFDASGRLVWAESGYRSRQEVLDLLSSVEQKLDAGSWQPYAKFSAAPALGATPLSKQAAHAALVNFEKQIFFRINSHDGGFHTPARHPYPDLLRELQEWANLGAPARVSRWVRLTMDSALRGRSPRLANEPLPDMTLDATQLVRLSRSGGGPGYRENVEQLTQSDPYLGLQDPFDKGVFRYAAGPGWYHPHFERRASDNLAWALTARASGQPARAREIEKFLRSKLVGRGKVASAQRADPFYYRLRPSERQSTPAPSIVEVYPLAVQARAARVFPELCSSLTSLDYATWPRALVGKRDSPPATPDDVGELLLALASCGAATKGEASKLSTLVVQQWTRDALPPMLNPSRLHRMVAGLCAVRAPECGRALAAVAALPLSLDHAPPLAALAKYID